MNILLLTQFFQPEPMFKGLPFAQALAARGHSVEVVTGFPNYPGGRLYPGYKVRPVRREILGGVPVLRLPLFPSHNSSGFGRAANYLTYAASAFFGAPLLSRKPDVIYVYNLVTLMPAARLLRLRYGCPIVLDVQDLWPESIVSSGMMRNRVLMRGLERFCLASYRAADRVTVLSPGFKRHLVNRGLAESSIEVIYNWCDEVEPRFGASSPTDFKKTKGMEGRFNVLFAGTMGKVQSLASVIETARMVAPQAPDVLFTFLGGGVEVERLKTLSAGLDNVQFLPRCSPAEALAVTAVADVLLVHLKKDPLFSITIPSKTQAYLYSGKPIVIGVPGDAADLVTRAGAGLAFEPESSIGLRQAILKLRGLTNSERAEMGQRGWQFYHEQLSFERGVARFEKLFSQLCIR